MRPRRRQKRALNTLSISVVSHFSPRDVLTRTLASLAAAVTHATDRALLAETRLDLIDNSTSAVEAAGLQELLRAPGLSVLRPQLVCAHENRGYGAGNNLSLLNARSDFHLILNPDVTLEEDAITEALQAMHAHPDCMLLTPRVTGEGGTVQHVAKGAPGFVTLLARALPLPHRLRDRLGNRQYELRELLKDVPVTGSFLAGGCFMFCRSSALQDVGGFDEGYFMYFEDFDLSARLAKVSPVLYYPAVRIVHEGGGAARKGLRHVLWFCRSAGRYFHLHGWRWMS